MPIVTSGASRVSVTEESPRARQFAGTPTSTAAFVGVTQKGPVNVSTLVLSFEEFLAVFGTYTSTSSNVVAAVQGFFDEGGQAAYIVRVVHYADITIASTKKSAAARLTGGLLSATNQATAASLTSGGAGVANGVGPWAVAPTSTLVVTLNAGAPAPPSVVTLTFAGTQALRESGTSAVNGAWAFNLTGLTLLVSIDGAAAQTITFVAGDFANVAAPTVQEVVNAINKVLRGGVAMLSSAGARVTIRSDRYGTTSGVDVSGGTAAAAGFLNFTAGNVAGTGTIGNGATTSNLANLDAVTLNELVGAIPSLVNAVNAGTIAAAAGSGASAGKLVLTTVLAGATASITLSGTGLAALGFAAPNNTNTGSASGAAVAVVQVDGKYDGAYANSLTVLVSAATSGLASEFNLAVLQGGYVIERYQSVSMASAASNYAVALVNRVSQLISLTDLRAITTGSGAADVPAPTNTSLNPNGFGPLAGGYDGTESVGGLGNTDNTVVANDFVGSSTTKTGLRALDTTQGLGIITVPGRTDLLVHLAMITYAETTREGGCIAILDPPRGLSAAQMAGPAGYVVVNGLTELSEYGVMYWPHVAVLNPSKAVFGSADTIVVPPSGLVAGLMARNDSAKPGGVYTTPAGVVNGVLRTARGLETSPHEVTDPVRRGQVFDKLVNPIMLEDGAIYVDGARTLKSTGNFPTVGERRGIIKVEGDMKKRLNTIRQRDIDEDLLAEAKMIGDQYMVGETLVGAFRSKDPKKAYFWDVGPALNPPSAIFARRLTGRLGVATKKPAEYINLLVGQDTRDIDAELIKVLT